MRQYDESVDRPRTQPLAEAGREARVRPVEPYVGEAENRDHEETDELRSEIEQTRAELGETIDAIQEKLDPQRLKEQAKDKAREATIGRVEDMMSGAGHKAQQAQSGILETIKQNPIPTMMAAAGIGWLLMKNRSDHSDGRPPYAAHSGDHYWSGNVDADRYTGSRQDAESAGGVAHRAQQAVGHTAQEAGSRLSQMGSSTQHQARKAQSTLDRMLHERPLAVGAVALGLGAGLGLLLPETNQEHQLFGEARDRVVDRAQSMVEQRKHDIESKLEEQVQKGADQIKQQVDEKVQQTADRTKDTARQNLG